MKLVLRFWRLVGVWTVLLFAILATVTLLSGQSIAQVSANLPVWGGMALVLSGFPAGIAVSDEVLAGRPPAIRPLVVFTLAAGVVCLLTFVLAGWVGPAIVRAVTVDPATGVEVADEARLPLGALREAMLEAEDRARTGGGEPLARWFPANRLAWHYYSRVDGSLLPLLFAWVGVLVGFWSVAIPRRDLRQAQHWLIGIFLVMTTYLAGENSYEMIVIHAAGPADFAADLRLIVPGLLVLALGWPAVLTRWRRRGGADPSVDV